MQDPIQQPAPPPPPQVPNPQNPAPNPPPIPPAQPTPALPPQIPIPPPPAVHPTTQPQPTHPSAASTLDPVTVMFLNQILIAQQHNNTLQAQARDDDRRARIEMAPTKFPRLTCLSQETVASWHTRVLAMIQQPKYSLFFDPISLDIVPNGNFNPRLNTLLFNELLTSFPPSIQDYIYSRIEIQNDGVALIRELSSIFQTSWTQLEKDIHTHD